ncbi:MAG: acetylxylan esterase [Caldilineaceae bacterium]|nr:acetylxylan esterase [Caldilineaceae bacterium]
MSNANGDVHDGFDHYWSALQAELAALSPAAELTEIPLRSTDFGVVYGLRLTSIGPARIFAYYCVPHGDGPFPVVYQLPNYGSVNHIPAYERRQRYLCVQLCHRGQRLADQPFAAAYPGLLTTRIDDPQGYIYRGIVADCLRVMDFLLARPEVDAGRIALVGNDLALFTAALRPEVDALYYTPGPFFHAAQLAPRTTAYPLEELNDYVRAYPEQAEQLWRTLAYFEPRHFAPRVRADTVLVTGSDEDFLSPARLAPLLIAFGGAVTPYITAHSSYKDGVHQEAWLRERYGFVEPLLPPHWRS